MELARARRASPSVVFALDDDRRTTYACEHSGEQTYDARDLAFGSSGTDVGAVQRALGTRATGVFDVATTRAVAEFQRAKSLRVTGVCDRATREALEGAHRLTTVERARALGDDGVARELELAPRSSNASSSSSASASAKTSRSDIEVAKARASIQGATCALTLMAVVWSANARKRRARVKDGRVKDGRGGDFAARWRALAIACRSFVFVGGTEKSGEGETEKGERRARESSGEGVSDASAISDDALRPIAGSFDGEGRWWEPPMEIAPNERDKDVQEKTSNRVDRTRDRWTRLRVRKKPTNDERESSRRVAEFLGSRSRKRE